jgi:membrane protease subunit (stomatin/prohibitin family)
MHGRQRQAFPTFTGVSHSFTPFLEDFMGLLDKLRGEFIDIIEWTEPTDNEALAYRFPRYQNEIKMGAQLTVREGQAAVFVNEGKMADVFNPGMYAAPPSVP